MQIDYLTSSIHIYQTTQIRRDECHISLHFFNAQSLIFISCMCNFCQDFSILHQQFARENVDR